MPFLRFIYSDKVTKKFGINKKLQQNWEIKKDAALSEYMNFNCQQMNQVEKLILEAVSWK